MTSLQKLLSFIGYRIALHDKAKYLQVTREMQLEFPPQMRNQIQGHFDLIDFVDATIWETLLELGKEAGATNYREVARFMGWLAKVCDRLWAEEITPAQAADLIERGRNGEAGQQQGFDVSERGDSAV